MQHKRLIAALTVLVMAVAGLGAAVLVRQGSGEPEPTPTKTTIATPTPTSGSEFVPANLLVTVVDTNKETAVASVQGTTSASQPVSVMSVPVNLSVDLDSKGLPSPLSKFSAPEIGSATYQVGNQMGLVMEGGWSMERVAFVALVDSVGGVEVGKKQRELTGKEAAKFVLEAKPVDGRSRVASRFDVVWSKVLVKLSNDQGRLMSILTSLGATSQRTMGVEDLAQLLTTLKTVYAANGVQGGQLPTAEVGKGTFRSVAVDVDRAVPQILSLYPKTQLTPGIEEAKPRVRVIFAGTTGAQALAVKNTVFEAEQTFVWGGPISAKAKPPKVTRIFVSSQRNMSQVGQPLAAAFNVKPETITVNAAQTLGVQATVVAS